MYIAIVYILTSNDPGEMLCGVRPGAACGEGEHLWEASFIFRANFQPNFIYSFGLFSFDVFIRLVILLIRIGLFSFFHMFLLVILFIIRQGDGEAEVAPWTCVLLTR